ncbi:MAG: hypothetical protein E7C49_01225 [Clostridium sp.]|nr:hypothetical protein [Clostridium sp.]
MIIREIIEHLNEDDKDRYNQLVLRIRIKNMFGLTEEQADKAYNIWKSEYMRSKNETVM